MDEQTGATHVYAIKEVMESEMTQTQISLEEARKINKELKIGDTVEGNSTKRLWKNCSTNSKTSNYSKIKRNRKKYDI